MRKIYLIIILCIILFSSFGCKPEIGDDVTTFYKILGKGITNEGNDLKQTPDGGFIIVGTMGTGIDNNGKDIYLIKTDANGNVQWEKKFGGRKDDIGQSITLTYDNGYAILGTTLDSLNFRKIYLIKVNQNGDTLFTKKYGRQYHNNGNTIVSLSDGSLIIGGATQTNTLGNNVAYFLKLNSSGSIIVEDSLKSSSEIYSCINYNNELYFAGRTSVETDQSNFYIKETIEKNLSSDFSNYTNGLEICYGTKKESDGTFIMWGSTSTQIGTSNDSALNIFIINMSHEYDTDNFTVNQMLNFGSKENEIAKDIFIDNSGNKYLVGTLSYKDDLTNSDIVIYGLNPNYKISFGPVKIGASGLQSANKIIRTADGGLLILGTSEYSKTSSILLIKTRNNGSLQ